MKRSNLYYNTGVRFSGYVRALYLSFIWCKNVTKREHPRIFQKVHKIQLVLANVEHENTRGRTKNETPNLLGFIQFTESVGAMLHCFGCVNVYAWT